MNLVNYVSLQHGDVIGEKQNQNIKQKFVSVIGRDLLPKLEIAIYSKTNAILFTIISLKNMSI